VDEYAPAEDPMYAEIYHRGTAGRSYNLADTASLAFTTDQVEAARKVAKTVSRVVLKEAWPSRSTTR